MQAFMSAVHGVMDLEVGCVWRSYGEIYYLTEEQELLPQVQQALLRKWLVKVSEAEVRYASMDSRKVVGPKPPASSGSKQVSISSFRADPALDTLRQDIAKLTGDVQSILNAQAPTVDIDGVKKDIAKLNSDIHVLASSVQSIVELLSKGVPVNVTQVEGQTKPTASISEQTAEELFIPTFKVQEGLSLQADSEKVEDSAGSQALEQLKKIRKKKNSDG